MRSSVAVSNQTVDSLSERITATLNLQLEYINQRFFREHPAPPTAVTLGVPVIVQHNGSSGIPAAEFRPGSHTIVINRSLPRMRCPLYVYRYLLFHERLHQIYPAPPGKPVHSDDFRAHEMRAPHRLKAIRWLKKRVFPVMDN